MKTFYLPDLGEGLQEAELVEWHVKAGDQIEADAPMVSVETAKAIVDIPAPRTTTIGKTYGSPGDVIHIGDPLVEFSDGDESDSQPSLEQEQIQKPQSTDTGTVVGNVDASGELLKDAVTPVGQHTTSGFKATPAVRALAHQLDVNLAMVTPTGADGMITASDVQRVHKILKEVGPQEPLRGVRRAMARNMALAHSEVVHVSLYDDADLNKWDKTDDPTVRLMRALIYACEQEPALNAWFDSHSLGRRVLPDVHLGVAVDSEDGLFVPVIRKANLLSDKALRKKLDELREKIKLRKIPPDELRGNTITLSNFGAIAGRYASPIIVPPTVAILGAGKIRDQVVAKKGKAVVHPILPLSLSFDHRCVTGGEAARFMAALLEHLQKENISASK